MLAIDEHRKRGTPVTVVMANGDVYDATYLSQDDLTMRCFVRLPSGNTCWVVAERVVGRME